MFRRLRQRGFARYYDRFQAPYEEFMGPRRDALLKTLDGRVLELGPGTGVNLPYFPRGIDWIGVEPNPFMRRQLTDRARSLGIEADYSDLDGGRIATEAGSVDAVVSTLVLCSVPDLTSTLAEIRRVLRPGGRFVFMEHVAAPRGTWTRRWQRAARPFWKLMADGCHPDREIDRALEGAGFASLELERFDVDRNRAAFIVAPHISGTATV